MNIKEWIDELVEKILGRKVNKGLLQYFRYLMCGGVATVTDVGILFVLTHFLHLNYLIVAAGELSLRHNRQLYPQLIFGFPEQRENQKRISCFRDDRPRGARLDGTDSLDFGGQAEYLCDDCQIDGNRIGSPMEFFHEKKICFLSGTDSGG